MGKVCDDRCKNEQEGKRNGLLPRPDIPDMPGHAAERGREITRHIYIMYGKRDIF